MRFFASISYNGSGFSGWQIQQNAPSIQEQVQGALSAVLGEKIEVTGAGRTDAGVNASFFTVHFDSGDSRLLAEHDRIVYKINAILPTGIRLSRIYRVRDDAHARFDATGRTYCYYIHHGKDPFASHFSWQCRYGLDLEAMNRGAAFLTGIKDFSCFQKTGSAAVSGICGVRSASWSRYTPMPVSLPDVQYSVFTITANRFLRNMVRAIVGSLVEVGRGRRSPEWIAGLIESRGGKSAGQSVPGHAMFLNGIEYPENIMKF